MQNKQVKPQKLTQTYIEEENILPKKFREEIEKSEIKVKSIIKETEDRRSKKRFQTLMKDKEDYRLLKLEKKILGPRQRILGTDRHKFMKLMKEVTGQDVKNYLEGVKPLEWRQFIVKLVCSTTGKEGEDLRNLWRQMYQGDLKWGVRDARRRTNEKRWSKKDTRIKRQDRNSWIAYSIRKSCISVNKKPRLNEPKSKKQEAESN